VRQVFFHRGAAVFNVPSPEESLNLRQGLYDRLGVLMIELGDPPRACVRKKKMASNTMSGPETCVGVVGLGHMGEAFARNLLQDGRRVVAYDRNPARGAALGQAGAEAAAGLEDLAQCDAVVTSLPDDETVAAVALGGDGLAKVMRRGAIHISMSTISPALSRRLGAEHGNLGQGFVAAPVLGDPDLARARQLFVLAAGRASDVEAARPLLERFGQKLFVIGQDPGQAALMKLAGNVLTATTLETMGEVMALLRKTGVEPHTAFDVLTNTLFDSRVHRTYGGKIVDEQYRPAGLAAPMAVKDMRLALDEAEREAVPMPCASLVHDRLVGLMARGWSDFDWSALGLLAAWEAGIGGRAVH
jgi:3-hydroxyisobutyrate dehydrogenase-like beta-hydroxyacid dehydrogenase